MTTVEVLRGARELLVTCGWGQTVYEAADGCLCSAGACNKASTGLARIKRQASADAQAALERATGAKPGMLAFWNDRRGRTVDEVLAAFDRAIAAEEALS